MRVRLRMRWPEILAAMSVLATLALPGVAPRATASGAPAGLTTPARSGALAAPLVTRAAAGAGARPAMFARPARAFAAPARPTQTSGALPGDFHEVALQGFGERANSEAWSMAWFNNHLFVGTARNLSCVKAAIAYISSGGTAPYPPRDHDILCPGSPPTVPDLPPTLGAQIWALTPTVSPSITQSNWGLAYQSPLTNTFTLLGQQVTGPRSMGYRGMSVFTDTHHAPTLFISGVSMKALQGHSAPPPDLLGTTDGISFTAVPSDPGTVMGDINLGGNCCLRDQVEYNGKLYVVITNLVGTGVIYAAGSPWRGNNAFQQFSPITMSVIPLAVFNGHLYLGTQESDGYRVYRTDAQCTSLPCPGSAFTDIVPPGGGLGANGNWATLSMQVFTDTAGVAHLYVGTDGAPTNEATEIISINADDSWDLIVGKPRTVNGQLIRPLSQLPAGFGWPYNLHMWRMAVDNGILYVGTFDASTAQKNYKGGSLLQNKMGFDLYASRDGTSFIRVTDNGFGDMFSEGARTMQDTPYGLFVGSNNFYYGLRIWQGGLSPAGLALAPYRLVASRAPHGQTALAWSAPPTATLFTVYSASLVPQKVGSKTYWTQADDTPITTTTATQMVDTSTVSDTTRFYYVVAQDGQGNLSEPSNSVASTMALTTDLTAAPRRGAVGRTVTVTGTAFAPNEAVGLSWDDGTPLGTALTDATGTFTATVAVPAAAPGAHEIVARGQSSNLSGFAPFYVTAAAGPSPHGHVLRAPRGHVLRVAPHGSPSRSPGRPSCAAWPGRPCAGND